MHSNDAFGYIFQHIASMNSFWNVIRRVLLFTQRINSRQSNHRDMFEICDECELKMVIATIIT